MHNLYSQVPICCKKKLLTCNSLLTQRDEEMLLIRNNQQNMLVFGLTHAGYFFILPAIFVCFSWPLAVLSIFLFLCTIIVRDCDIFLLFLKVFCILLLPVGA